MTVRMSVDGRTAELDPSERKTVLDVARELGCEIPTLCHRDGLRPSGACMICVVEERLSGRLIPSCSTTAEEGMTIVTRSERIDRVRTGNLALLAGEHYGDCEAPCSRTCPAGMDIPSVIRRVNCGDVAGAAAVARERIPIPAVLGRICPAPCERACRRGDHDEPIEIAAVERHIGDAILNGAAAPVPPPSLPAGASDHRVAVVGAGPAGASAAFYLLRAGVPVTVFDEHELPGGALRYSISSERLPEAVVDASFAFLLSGAAEFRGRVCVGRDLSPSEVERRYDAVVVAAPTNGFEPRDGVFECRHLRRSTGRGTGRRMAVRAVAAGRRAALEVLEAAARLGRPFDSRTGRMKGGELDRFVAAHELWSSGPGAREANSGLCLSCDCAAKSTCTLRDLCDRYDVSAKRYPPEEQCAFERLTGRVVVDGAPYVVAYEPGKCIACGICVRLSEHNREPAGMMLSGRGNGMRVVPPAGAPVETIFGPRWPEYAAACPTGALHAAKVSG